MFKQREIPVTDVASERFAAMLNAVTMTLPSTVGAEDAR
jgi:hypothetical protein